MSIFSFDILAFYLIQKGYPTTSLHGDRLQSQRELALKEFKNGKSNTPLNLVLIIDVYF